MKKNLVCNMLEKNNWWMILEYREKGEIPIILIFIYFNPSYDISEHLRLLNLSVENFSDEFLNYRLLIFGDFNARVGNLNNSADGRDGERFNGWQADEERVSLDSVANTRGLHLLEYMERLDMHLINGRCKSDKPGNFTFFGSNDGKSTIDLAWGNDAAFDILNDLEVDDFCHSSDHLPVTLKLSSKENNYNDLQKTSNNLVQKTSLKWKEENAEKFKA